MRRTFPVDFFYQQNLIAREPTHSGRRGIIRPPSTPLQALMEAPPGEEPRESTMEQRHPVDIALAEALEQVSDEERQLAVMALVEGIALSEIGEHFGISKSAAYRRVTKVRSKLAGLLMNHSEVRRYLRGDS